MARVDLNQFTTAVNSFEEVINSIKTEVDALYTAATKLGQGMTGTEAEQLTAKCKELANQLYNQEEKIRKVITKVQSENDYYVRNLGVLE